MYSYIVRLRKISAVGAAVFLLVLPVSWAFTSGRRRAMEGISMFLRSSRYLPIHLVMVLLLVLLEPSLTTGMQSEVTIGLFQLV